jgi:hypothetical protein
MAEDHPDLEGVVGRALRRLIAGDAAGLFYVVGTPKE